MNFKFYQNTIKIKFSKNNIKVLFILKKTVFLVIILLIILNDFFCEQINKTKNVSFKRILNLRFLNQITYSKIINDNSDLMINNAILNEAATIHQKLGSKIFKLSDINNNTNFILYSVGYYDKIKQFVIIIFKYNLIDKNYTQIAKLISDYHSVTLKLRLNSTYYYIGNGYFVYFTRKLINKNVEAAFMNIAYFEKFNNNFSKVSELNITSNKDPYQMNFYHSVYDCVYSSLTRYLTVLIKINDK